MPRVFRSVGCTFIFGFILLLLSTIFFFLGSNAFKICQDIQGPDYPAFANVSVIPTYYKPYSALFRGTNFSAVFNHYLLSVFSTIGGVVI